jgi:hypothetical protein
MMRGKRRREPARRDLHEFRIKASGIIIQGWKMGLFVRNGTSEEMDRQIQLTPVKFSIKEPSIREYVSRNFSWQIRHRFATTILGWKVDLRTMNAMWEIVV